MARNGGGQAVERPSRSRGNGNISDLKTVGRPAVRVIELDRGSVQGNSSAQLDRQDKKLPPEAQLSEIHHRTVPILKPIVFPNQYLSHHPVLTRHTPERVSPHWTVCAGGTKFISNLKGVIMRIQLAFMGALLLAAGCAHRNYENRVVVSDNRSPYVANSSTYDTTTTYGSPAYGTVYSSSYYGPYYYSYWRDYDNTSKGSGARALMANPYAQYPEPAGAALVVGDTEPETSRGAGARSLTSETAVRTDNPGV